MLGCRSWASHAFASKCRETNRMEMAALECFILVVFFGDHVHMTFAWRGTGVQELANFADKQY